MGYEKRFNAFMIFFLCLLLGGIFYYTSSPSQDVYEAQEFLMDTFVTVKIQGPNGEQVLGDLLREMRRLEKILSRHVEGSDIYELNRQAGISKVPVEDVTMELLKKSMDYGEITGGAFDITIAPLLSLWGFGEEKQRVPSREEIENVLPLLDYSALELQEEEMTAYLPRVGMAIDLGGIAKGYIVDKGIVFLEEKGITRALISAGGDIRVFGGRPGGGPWRIGIRDPFGNVDEHLGLILRMEEGSVDTSGSYERFFQEEGEIYHHILDPETGYPARGLMSATVVHPSSGVADILSTALFVLGLEEGQRLITSLEGVEAMIITEENQSWFSPGFLDLTKED